MAARDLTIVRGDNVLGTHSLGEGEVVSVSEVKRPGNPDPDVESKAASLVDYVVTLGVPAEEKAAAKPAAAKAESKK